MPSKAELMASSLPPAAAGKLGVELASTATAAGTTQGTATVLTGNFVNVTTPALNNGVQIGFPFERNFIYNSGPFTLTVYPHVGGTIMGLAANAGATLAQGSSMALEGDGVTYFANVGI